MHTAVATIEPEEDDEGFTRIPRREYISLQRQALELQLLEQMGVDNWEGYSEVDWNRLDEFDEKNR